MMIFATICMILASSCKSDAVRMLEELMVP
jgi:hypothetical protein